MTARALIFGTSGQFASLNALTVIWCWLYLARRWEEDRKFTTTERDDFRKRCDATLASVLDRWLICSQWAGRWAGSSQKVVAKYAEGLQQDQMKLSRCVTPDDAHRVLLARANFLVDELKDDASTYIDGTAAQGRDRVSVYRNLLWVWHRLSASRWAMSQIPLRTTNARKSVLEVDHVVSYCLWQEKMGAALPTGISDPRDAERIANLLGNCSLLEKTFNISKGKRPLAEFLSEVHEFKAHRVTEKEWATALALGDPLMHPTLATVDAIAQAIEERTRLIREELKGFIAGRRARVDI